jgi:hypothetical protein
LVAASCSDNGGAPGASEIAALVKEVAEEEAAASVLAAKGFAAEGSATRADGSPARRAVRESIRQVLVASDRIGAEVGRYFRRPQLQSYLLLADSYVGGSFPATIAELLRKVQALEDAYLAETRGFAELLASKFTEAGVSAEQALVAELAAAFAAERKPLVAAVEAHREFVVAAAELYELVASQPESIRSLREGLEISDPALLERFNSRVDAVNSAIDATDFALRALDSEQRKSVHWMGLAKRVER